MTDIFIALFAWFAALFGAAFLAFIAVLVVVTLAGAIGYKVVTFILKLFF